MEEGRRGSTASLSCEAGTWERHPDQWRWVLWIFEQVARGKGGKIVAKMLNERGVPPPRGGAWSAETVRRIVHSPAYTGRLVRRMNDSEFTFEVPVIVPPDLWRIANEAIEGNRRTSPRNRKHEYLPSSTRDAPLLCCRVCHETMGKDYLMGGRSNGTKTKPEWLFYQCNGRHGRDAAHTVSAQRIEAAVWDTLVALLTSPRVALEHIAKLSDTASKQYHEHEQALAGLHERAAEVRAARVRLAEAAAWGKLPAEILEAQATALEEQAQEIAGQISLAHVQLEQARAEVVPIKDIEDACALLAAGAQAATFEQRRWIVYTLVQRIYADRTHWVLEGRLPCLSAAGTLQPQQRAQQGDNRPGEASIDIATS